MKGPPIGFAQALPSNSKTRLKRVSKGKPSSLLGLIISYVAKKFYNIDPPGVNVIKLFFFVADGEAK